MADNLPLIPSKGEAVCADVRPVLREVFREVDQLPPLALEKSRPSDEERFWIENYKTQCDEIWHQEGELKKEFAKRISKKRQKNLYRLSSPRQETVASWRVERGLIGRKDLMPSIEQNAGREKSLWVQNILNRSSCDFRTAERVYENVRVPLQPVCPDAYSLQTLSYGELKLHPPPLPPSEQPPPATPEYVICVPPTLDFVNFTLGRLHTQQIRLVNVSKFEVRLALTPPQRRELDVELCGPRGLTVTAGSAAELKVHFRPTDVRAVHDALRVRVSVGKSLVVPIACFMQPPILQVIVPYEISSVFPLSPGSEAWRTSAPRDDVLDLGSKLLGDVHCAPILLQSSATHASFFIITEDAWISYTLEELTSNGSIVTGPFTVYPAWFRGGGVTRGFVQCRATAPGLHAAALRILSSTAVARMMHVLADSLYFSPDHVTIQAEDKDYDICSEDDPDCEYYVNLGTAFPNRPLSATVQIVNHSPVPYSYYWSSRPWGVCSCWQDELATEGAGVTDEGDSERLCPGARESRAKGDGAGDVWKRSWQGAHAQPAAGGVAARGVVPVTVSVADAGAERGRHRAVLQGCLEAELAGCARAAGGRRRGGARCRPCDRERGRRGRRAGETSGRAAAGDAWKPSWQGAHAQPAAGGVAARGVVPVTVSVADAGTERGRHRAVLQLILKDIPKDSFPADLKPQVVNTRTVAAQTSPPSDGKGLLQEVCEVVVAQMEVWWEVAPVRFVLDPLILPLTHSRRKTSVGVSIRATQLFGCSELRTRWLAPPCPLPPAPRLTPARSVDAHLVVPLPSLPNDCPQTDVVMLVTDTEEWSATCRLERACATRHPALAPARAWLGVVPPGARVSAKLKLFNDTHQHICWWATPFRWLGENTPSAPCAASGRPCENWDCRERACTCTLLRPRRGSLGHAQCAWLHFAVNSAPSTDRCVATLVQVRRTLPDVSRVAGAAGCCARASLVAYRVLAPRLVLRALPCRGDKTAACLYVSRVAGAAGCCARASLVAYRVLAPRLVLRALPCRGDKMAACKDCRLDPGQRGSPRGCAVLRPSAALAQGHRSCYTLRVTNLTPIPTTVQWEPPIEGDDILKVKFIPNDFDIGSHAEKEIQVVLEAKKVCGRRLFAHRARVAHAYKPLYLLIDAAIEGVKIIVEVPLGVSEGSDSFVSLRGTQKEEFSWEDKNKPTSAAECFAENDRKMAIRQENTCRCHFEMVYIPPPKVLRPPPESEEVEYQPVEIITKRTVLLRNVGELDAKWRMVVRRWPRQKDRASATVALAGGTDRWAGDVRSPGVAIQCLPAAGACAAGSRACVDVLVYADCWGCYKDQLLLMVEGVEPIVIDIWIEVVGKPLKFAVAGDDPDYDATMWLSASDPQRTLRVKNTSRAQLTVHAYTLMEHEYKQDVMPFRLYMRFFDVLPPTCPCLAAVPSDDMLGEEGSVTSSSIPEEMDTGIDLFLAADFGPQDHEYYKVEPQKCSVPAGAWVEWRVSLLPRPGGEPAPPGLLLFRTLPDDDRGEFWRRGEPRPARAAMRVSPRAAVLRLSRREVRVQLCALDLPYKDVVRVRKRFRVQNTGSAPLALACLTAAPWRVVLGEPSGGICGCTCVRGRGERPEACEMMLEPRSSTAMCVEVCVHTEEMWPATVESGDDCQTTSYPPQRTVQGDMAFHSEQNLLQSLPLILEVEYPQLFVEPATLDFGFVTDGDTRKTYFTVWHSSMSSTIDLSAAWSGGERFRLFPQRMRLPAGARQRIYLQYTARWSGGPYPVEGRVLVCADAGAGAWCRAAVRARAQPARDHKCRAPPHDHTDDQMLLPPL